MKNVQSTIICDFCGEIIKQSPLDIRNLFCSTSCKDSFFSSKYTIENILAFTSVRKFKTKKIPAEIQEKILEIGRHTPSARNIQPWNFIIISDIEIKKKLSKFAKFIENSPFIIVGCGNPEISPNWYKIEVAIAMQSMVLAAWIQGIGSCWVDIKFNNTKIKEILEIPDRLEVIALIAFGYPDENPKSSWKKPLNQIIHYNKF